jgi:hypothetical protein
MSNLIICSFSSGLGNMKRKDQKDVVKVLRVLDQCGRYSVFEATDNQTIAAMMDCITRKKCTLVGKDRVEREYGRLLRRTGGAYPWTEIELTEGGKQLLKDNPT